MLENPEIYQKAVRHAATISAETQVSPAPSMRAEIYTEPLTRTLLTFTAFKFRQIQIFGQLLGRWEGATGERAKAILKRGVSEEAKQVEVLRDTEFIRGELERLAKDEKYKKGGGGNVQALNTMIQFYKQREANLNKIIKEIEPLSGTRGRAVGVTARYMAEIFMINAAFSFLWDLVGIGATPDEQLGGEGSDEYYNKMLESAVERGLNQLISVPYQNRTSLLPEGQALNIGAPLFKLLTGQGLERQTARPLASWIMSVVPYLGVADRISGRRLQDAILDEIIPKKNQSKSGPFGKGAFKSGIGKSAFKKK